MFFYLFSVLMAYYIVKPVSRSMFLTRFDVDKRHMRGEGDRNGSNGRSSEMRSQSSRRKLFASAIFTEKSI
jgi:hypothetical protein